MEFTLRTNRPLLEALGSGRKLERQISDLLQELTTGVRIKSTDRVTLESSLRRDQSVAKAAFQNLNQGASQLQVASEGLAAMEGLALQMKSYTDIASGNIDQSQRDAIDQELAALRTQFNDIAANTSFGSTKLLDGSATEQRIQVEETAIEYALGENLNVTYETGGSPGTPDGTFDASSTTTPLFGALREVASGDFDGDGKVDIIATTSNGLSLQLGNADGTFQAATDPYGVSTFIGDIAVADMNGDGKQDLVFYENGAYTLHIGLGNGNGTFGNWTSLVLNSNAGGGSLLVEDVTGDGKLDTLVVQNNNLAVATGDGTGGYSGFIDIGYTGTSPTVADSITSGDVDGDTDRDIVIGTTDQGPILFLSNGNGTYGAGASLGLDNGRPVELRDLNGDSKLDLAYLSSTTADLNVSFGDGAGGFAAISQYAVNGPGGAPHLELQDINDDGILDAIALSTNKLNVLFGNSNGTFGAAVIYNDATDSVGLLVTDINDDGAADVLTTDGATTINIRLGNLTGGSPGQEYTSRSIPTLSVATVAAAEESGAIIDEFLSGVIREQGVVDGVLARAQSAYSLQSRRVSTLGNAYDQVRGIEEAEKLAQYAKTQIRSTSYSTAINAAISESSRLADLIRLLK